MTVTLYHNPACSKSRAALALLEERGIAPEIVLYLESPPDAATLDAILTKLSKDPRDILRTEEPEYVALGLERPMLSRTELLTALAAHPNLLQRPIVVAGERAALGRPLEAITALFEQR